MKWQNPQSEFWYRPLILADLNIIEIRKVSVDTYEWKADDDVD